jgi:hypothetical protein
VLPAELVPADALPVPVGPEPAELPAFALPPVAETVPVVLDPWLPPELPLELVPEVTAAAVVPPAPEVTPLPLGFGPPEEDWPTLTGLLQPASQPRARPNARVLPMNFSDGFSCKIETSRTSPVFSIQRSAEILSSLFQVFRRGRGLLAVSFFMAPDRRGR